ncbi:hypothetical protein FISHEDRAFT_72994 [Fistulina hepatica ATCC 64428]|uniref:Uncharacterized protein n=1 Tax=Fistulina hepatica ATCC 64428 TaxID=1128425 RepID=A0A0D7AF77_9AGAR|nr:hypothetical protein FISHEDRAFT_72994 [Fistulina hepatica ATCC 64428]
MHVRFGLRWLSSPIVLQQLTDEYSQYTYTAAKHCSNYTRPRYLPSIQEDAREESVAVAAVVETCPRGRQDSPLSVRPRPRANTFPLSKREQQQRRPTVIRSPPFNSRTSISLYRIFDNPTVADDADEGEEEEDAATVALAAIEMCRKAECEARMASPNPPSRERPAAAKWGPPVLRPRRRPESSSPRACHASGCTPACVQVLPSAAADASAAPYLTVHAPTSPLATALPITVWHSTFSVDDDSDGESMCSRCSSEESVCSTLTEDIHFASFDGYDSEAGFYRDEDTTSSEDDSNADDLLGGIDSEGWYESDFSMYSDDEEFLVPRIVVTEVAHEFPPSTSIPPVGNDPMLHSCVPPQFAV